MPEQGPDTIVVTESPAIDNDSLNALFRASWPEHRDRDFRTVLATSLVTVAAFDGNRLVGFANVATDGGEHAFLLDPTVLPSYRHRGVGTAMVRRAIDAATRRGCRWMHVDYVAALQPFYRGAGFRESAAGVMKLDDTPSPAGVQAPSMTELLPFDKLRARGVLLQTFVAALALVGVSRVVPMLHSTSGAAAAANDPLTFTMFYIGVAAVLWLRARMAGLDVRRLFGPPPSRETIRLTVVAIPLGVLSVAGVWVLFLPISFFAPEFVRSHALDGPSSFVPSSVGAWSGQLIVAAVIAPVIEEILFRGFLMQRWARRWGTATGVVASSALFAVCHVELMGHFLFGVAMCALYLRTKSLWVPIVAHALNNFLALALTLPQVVRPDAADSTMTVAKLQSEWWVGVLLLAAGAALLEIYRRRFWPNVDLRALFRGPVPYAS
ncbi:MAG TPA: GNAT family N-acetyltransferase [Gemmatimonadaceae bacterium]|nr:GNAT family N-acetyltransferase [Gemmatimonadaceae bacterium]